MSSSPETISGSKELLIASVTPQNLERGVLWFTENEEAVKKARASNPWWHDNTVVIEQDFEIKLSFLARRIAEFGYERGQRASAPGLFAVQGSIIQIWPINKQKPYLIEFTGNVVSLIKERTEAEEKTITLKPPPESVEGLRVSSFIVHADHGIGIFKGKIPPNPPLQSGEHEPLFEKGGQGGFYVVEYAAPAPGREPDRLLVPVDQKDRLTPYVGFETPRIHRLGGTVWQTTKRKVREDALKLAKELLELYAKREQAIRPPYAGDTSLEQELRDTFPYRETPDQLEAEKLIIKDLSGTRPMDRVLCGDVGFGKTEIALRAIMRVVSSGKQVALLSPTTILAAQHEKTLNHRFAGLPVKITMLSRLTPKKDEKKIIEDIKQGKIDVVVGTHRLLSKDIGFRDLGLVVIDEEQRFGVRQKERFKDMRSEVDILSLSATPIPRTLHLALAHLRDISIIRTPPPERKSIQTFVLPYSPKIIREAIEYELNRGGQVYFLHNRIETIGAVKQRLEKITKVHKLRIGILHGRMGEQEIIHTMDGFRERELNVLLATTIIENGLDIASANTLIVDDGTRLGLSQAHQLRGRIGRTDVQAHAYFLFKAHHLTEQAAERLEALKEYADLGSGYDLALRDLEIRGAGNILGREQSGAINKVGLNLYYQMLSEAIEELKS